ncbi:MAG: hypothetical protein V3V14_07240 [Saprospiraceae bacterium]
MKIKSPSILNYIGILLLIILSNSCRDDEPKLTPDNADDNGNLVIANHSGHVLALYRPSTDEILKIIPNSAEDFLVKVSNPNRIALDLRIRRVINGEVEVADFKRWDIALSKDDENEHRARWFIRNENDEIYSGTLSFNYVGGTDYQVDILLNSKNGAKIITLKPGDQYENQVGIDYANYTVHYRYWLSDPNNNQASQEIGWIEKEEINQNEVDIFVVLNDSHKNRTLQVPHYNSGSVIGGTIIKGKLRAINKKSVPVQIWVGSDLIEDFATPNPQSQNISTIPANGFQEYEMPIGFYVFSARDIQSAATLESIDTTIIQNQIIEWKIQ